MIIHMKTHENDYPHYEPIYQSYCNAEPKKAA